MTSMQSAMNFLKRRFSENNFANASTSDFVADSDKQQTVSASPVCRQSSDSPRKYLNRPTAENATGETSRGTEGPSSTPSQSSASGFFASFTSGNPLMRLRQLENEQSTKHKILLVIDDHHTDWSKYFKGKKIHDYAIRVEQASFSEISVYAVSSEGVTVDINCIRGENKVIKSFRPHFLLVRQAPRSMADGEDYRNLIIGLKYGGIPSVNSLHSIYNFLDRPWTFAQLIRIQKRLGTEKFPLIEQTYYPNHKQMLTSSHFPVVIKIGHANRGMAKLKVNNHHHFQDVAGVVALTGTYAVTERFVESKFDIRVQKIGGTYRTYVRTSISNNWKANTGSAMLEEIPVTDRHRLWVDACSEMFGGLDIVSVKALHGADGQDYIIEVSDCAMPLIGESQEEDRQIISEVVLQRMNASIRPRPVSTAAAGRMSQSQLALNRNYPAQGRHTGASDSSSSNRVSSAPASYVQSAPTSAAASPPGTPEKNENSNIALQLREDARNAPSASEVTSNSAMRGASEDEQSKAEKIRNLRKSFASIFGD